MSHLNAIDALTDEALDSFARSSVGRVGEDRQSAGAMNQRDGVSGGQALLRHVGGTPIPQVAIERVAEIDRPPFGDHRARDVRTANRAARRLLED